PAPVDGRGELIEPGQCSAHEVGIYRVDPGVGGGDQHHEPVDPTHLGTDHGARADAGHPRHRIDDPDELRSAREPCAPRTGSAHDADRQNWVVITQASQALDHRWLSTPYRLA